MFIWGKLRNEIRLLDRSVVIQDVNKPFKEKEAVLFLVGLRNPSDGFGVMKRYFSSRGGYDFFVPDYISRVSVCGCVDLLKQFIEANRIKQYKRVHVLAGILGGHCLNRMLKDEPWQNLANVVYLRSPLQERVPAIISKRRPLVVRACFGTVVRDLASRAYPLMPPGVFRAGLLVESKPTPYVVSHQKAVMDEGNIDWSLDQFQGDWADTAYLNAHHDEIYCDPAILWEPLVSFINEGQFQKNAARTFVVTDAIRPFAKNG